MKIPPDPGELDVTHVRDDRATCANPYCDARVAYRGDLCGQCRSEQDGERRRLRNEAILTQATDRWMRDR